MKFRIAVIGLGYISRFYLKALVENSQIEIVAVCDLDLEKQSVAEELRVNFYLNYRTLLKNEKIDGVVVLTPNFSHFTVVIDCLDAGVNIICEKPLAVSLEQTVQLLKKAAEKNIFLITAYHRRFHKKIKSLKERLAGKVVRAVHARYMEDIREHSFNEQWYLSRAKSGGGVVLDNGTNILDVLFYLVGELHLKSAHVGYQTIGSEQVDVNAYLQLTNPIGSRVSVELDWLYNGEVKDICVYLESGEVERVDFLADFSEFKGSLWHEYAHLIEDCVNIFKRRTMPKDSTQLVMEIIDQAYQSK